MTRPQVRISTDAVWRLSARVRGALWRLQLGRCGRHLSVDVGTRIRNPSRVWLGDDCWLKERVILDGRSEREAGIVIGDRVVVRTGAYIDAYDKEGFVRIGNRAGIGQYVYIGGNGGVTIGDDVMISGHTYIVAARRYFDRAMDVPYREQGESRRGVVIGRNAWIAANCVILDGVSIGADTVIGAGSVVTKNMPSGVVAFGNPARVVREVPHRDIRSAEQAGQGEGVSQE